MIYTKDISTNQHQQTFNKNTIMPNWYNDTLYVMGKPEEVAVFKSKAAERVPFEEPSPLHFHNFVPIPPDLLKFGGETRKGYDLKIGGCSTKEEWDEKIGEESRKEWEIAHWGAKWGACRAELVEEHSVLLIYHFDTAWCPPMRFMEQLARMYPNVVFRLNSISVESCGAYDFMFAGDFFDATDLSWTMEAQMSCTCGAWGASGETKEEKCQF
jgi:hypothetical protein